MSGESKEDAGRTRGTGKEGGPTGAEGTAGAVETTGKRSGAAKAAGGAGYSGGAGGAEGPAGIVNITETAGDLSFTKADRLLKSDDFARVRREGRRLYAKSFTLFILPNALGKTRLGLSVGARVAGSPGRNRIKRLIREFYRLNRGSFPESSDLLVSVKSVENIKGYRDLEEEFRKVLMG